MDDDTTVREAVRERYAAAARTIAQEQGASCCGPASTGSSCCGAPVQVGGSAGAFGGGLYGSPQVDDVTRRAIDASLGCGVPTAVADLVEGDVVLDLGCGAGGDVLLSAQRVGPTGRVYGLDMTDEMLALAQENVRDAGVQNVVLLKGSIEAVPLPAESVDVVISNCVINLATDTSGVLREAARIVRAGGRFAVSDVVADPDMPDEVRADMEAFTGCIAGALTRAQFTRGLEDNGSTDVEVIETHRVHEHAAAAIIRARRAG